MVLTRRCKISLDCSLVGHLRSCSISVRRLPTTRLRMKVMRDPDKMQEWVSR